MMRDLLVLRAVERGSVAAVSMTLGLSLAAAEGLVPFTLFLAMSATGGTTGSVLVFLMSRRAAPPSPRFWLHAQAALRVAAATLAMYTGALEHLAVAGMLLSFVSAPVNSMTHTEASRRAGGLGIRARLTAATAAGGAVGTTLAGFSVERSAAWVPLALAILVWAVVPRGTKVFAQRRATPDQPAGAQTAGARSGDVTSAPPSVAKVVGVSVRLAVIANLAFAPALVAPGIVTEISGASVAGLASAGYQIGAVLTVPALGFLNRLSASRASERLSGGPAVFFLAGVTAPIWLVLTRTPLAAVAVCLVMGTVLFLLQAGFEQQGANLAAHVYAGPTVAILHGVLALSGLGSVLAYPPLISHFGLDRILWTSAAILITWGLATSVRARPGMATAGV